MSNTADAPFRTVIASSGEDADAACNVAESGAPDDEWDSEALEAAYLRALEAAEVADAVQSEWAPAEPEAAGDVESTSSASIVEPVAKPVPDSTPETSPAPPGVTPRQVVEALLFVGGQPLTGKRLADLLGGGFTHEQVDELIDEVNARYARQARPYEVRLGEGGYRLALRPEFERVRERVYGYGPREVKLSQDALEVLALVAYQQPVSRETVEQTGKPNASAVLRQLLQRELISLQRGDGGKDDVTYHTTPRFLQLFGLGSLDDLPLPEDLMFK
jgi:segregation and condensation protein B